MTKFSKIEALEFGWKTTTSNLKFLIGLMIIVLVIYLLLAMIGQALEDEKFLSFIFSLITWAIQLIVSLGLIKIAIKFCDKKKPLLSDLYTEYPKTLKYLLASIIVGIITFIGFILLIVPGIIFAIKLQFVPYLIADKNLGPFEAIKTSWRITKGVKWNLFLFALLAILVNIGGALLLLVGLLVTIPTTSIATAYIYRKLSS